MDREELFVAFIAECEKRGEICGQGNPNADILIIGKEHYCCEDTTDPILIKRRLELNYELCRDKERRKAPRPKDRNPTWSNYQKLIEAIDQTREHDPNVRDFEEMAFTTELNTAFRPQSPKVLDETTKGNIRRRLDFFRQSEFIQSFNIVVLACGNYIVNNEQRGYQINETFGVEFDKEGGEIVTPNGYWFCTHHNKKDTGYCKAGEKLVIHTRQLSRFYKKDDLTGRIAAEISKHTDDKLRRGSQQV